MKKRLKNSFELFLEGNIDATILDQQLQKTYFLERHMLSLEQEGENQSISNVIFQLPILLLWLETRFFMKICGKAYFRTGDQLSHFLY